MIEDYIERMAWRLRAHLPDCWSDLTEEEALASLFLAEQTAARYQLPQFAASRYQQCAYKDERGRRCLQRAAIPPIYGFVDLDEDLKQAQVARETCRPFIGALCQRHMDLLVVPPASWWPDEIGVREEVLV